MAQRIQDNLSEIIHYHKLGYPFPFVKKRLRLDGVDSMDDIYEKFCPVRIGNTDGWLSMLWWWKMKYWNDRLLKFGIEKFLYPLMLHMMMVVMMIFYSSFIYARVKEFYSGFKLDLNTVNIAFRVINCVLILHIMVLVLIVFLRLIYQKNKIVILAVLVSKVEFVKLILSIRFSMCFDLMQSVTERLNDKLYLMKNCNDWIFNWQSYHVGELLQSTGSIEEAVSYELFDYHVSDIVTYHNDSRNHSDIIEMAILSSEKAIVKAAAQYKTFLYIGIGLLIYVLVQIQLAPIGIMEGL